MKRTQSFRWIASRLPAGAALLSVTVAAVAAFGGNALALFTTPGEPVAEFLLLDMTAGEPAAAAAAQPRAATDEDTEVQLAHWENTTGPRKLSGNQ